jgi:hypothetical protein
MDLRHRELFERCAEVVRRTKITDAYGEIYLDIGNGARPRAYRCIEHTFHEVAHAVLCGIPTNTLNLSLAISETMGHTLEGEANEARTFAACTLAFDHFEIPYHRGDLCCALSTQCLVTAPHITWPEVELLRAEPLVRHVSRVLAELQPAAPVRAPIRRIVGREQIGRWNGELLTLDCGHTSLRAVRGIRMSCYVCLVKEPS